MKVTMPKKKSGKRAAFHYVGFYRPLVNSMNAGDTTRKEVAQAGVKAGIAKSLSAAYDQIRKTVMFMAKEGSPAANTEDNGGTPLMRMRTRRSRWTPDMFEDFARKMRELGITEVTF